MTKGMDNLWWEQMDGLLRTHELPTMGDMWEMGTHEWSMVESWTALLNADRVGVQNGQSLTWGLGFGWGVHGGMSQDVKIHL